MSRSKPLSSNSFLFGLLVLVGVINCIITGITISRFVKNKILAYTYLDGDNPVLLPVSTEETAEMTIQESNRFNISDLGSTAAWNTLATNQPGVGFVHIGPYHWRFIAGVHHQLHCLQRMQAEFMKPCRRRDPHPHFAHCVQYLRQTFLCGADATLEDGDFMTRDFEVERDGSIRQCRNWPYIFDYVNENFEEWEAFNGVFQN